MAFHEHERVLWRVLFDFGEYGSFTAVLGFVYYERPLSATVMKSSVVKKIIASLPIASESLVLDDVELLVKLPTRFKQTIYKRDHIIKRGDIVYRPHIPSISVFARSFETYEPVERIGLVRKDSLEKLAEIIEKIKSKASVYVEIRRYEAKEAREEEE